MGLDERGITNLAVYGVDHLAHLIKQRLRACQNQTDLIAGFLAHTGMTSNPNQPDPPGVSLSPSAATTPPLA